MTSSRRERVLQWLAYQADRALGLSWFIKAAVLLLAVALFLVLWGALLRYWYPSDPSARTAGDALWWAITLFIDPGSVVGVRSGERFVAFAITASGIVSVSFLTGLVAGSVTARIDALRSGTGPAIERGHLLVLGFDEKVTWVAREYAASRRAGTMVVLSEQRRRDVESRLEESRARAETRARFVVREGSPHAPAALARVSAAYAEAIIVVPPSTFDDESAARWSLATLLAVRQAVGTSYGGTIVAEVRRSSLAPLLSLAAEADVAGKGALPLRIVAADETIARVLAQSARQAGVHSVLRELLSTEGNELHAEPVPALLHGKTFDEVHARVLGGIVVGVLKNKQQTLLNPPGNTLVSGQDQLLVLAPSAGSVRVSDALRTVSEQPTPRDPSLLDPKEQVVVVGFNDTLPFLVRELDHMLGAGSALTLLVPPGITHAAESVRRLQSEVRNLQLKMETREPTQPLGAGDQTLLDADAVVILGAQDAQDVHGDASALAYLLWLRHGLLAANRKVRRVVTEVRDVRSAGTVSSSASDVLVSADAVAMMLLQNALQPATAAAYDELLRVEGQELFVLPRTLYAGTRAVTFAEVQAAARIRGEIALGVLLSANSAPRLLPPRELPIPTEPTVLIIVMSPSR